MSAEYSLVQLSGGAWSVRSEAHAETFHPVVGPMREAEALYVRQLNIRARFADAGEAFVLWDVGLGAAANPLAVLEALRGLPGIVEIHSFDLSLDPLRFALQHTERLAYLAAFREPLAELMTRRSVAFDLPEGPQVRWQFHEGDFPSLLQTSQPGAYPPPHAVLFDAFSPARNPAMWTLPLFRRLHQLLDPARPCALPTYSRSTMLRVTLLLAGFYVGAGHATGEKEETTLAANTLDLLEQPLERSWLARVRRSTSAEPLIDPFYRQAPLSPANREALCRHPQFAT